MSDNYSIRQLLLSPLFSLLFYSGLAVLIALSLYLSLAKFYLSNLDQYRTDIETSLGFLSGYSIDIGKVSGELWGLDPHIMVHNITLQTDNKKIFSANNMEFMIDVFDSIWARELRISQLKLDQAALSLYQSADNDWTLYYGRVQRGEEKAFSVKAFLLALGYVNISDAHIQFNYADGRQIITPQTNILLERVKDFRRLNIEMTESAGSSTVLSFLAEGNGKPGSDNYTARWKLSTHNLDIDFLSPLFMHKQQTIAGQLGNTHISAWIEEHQQYFAFGELDVKRLSISAGEQQLLDIGQLNSQFEWTRDAHKYLARDIVWLADTYIHHGGVRYQLADRMKLQHNANDIARQFEFTANKMNAGLVADIASTSAYLKESVRDILQGVDVKAKAKDAQLFIHYEKRVDDMQSALNWQASANLEQLRTRAYNNIPSINSIDAHIWLNRHHGMLAVPRQKSPVNWFAKNVYDSPLRLDELRVNIYWHNNQRGAYIYTDHLSARINQAKLNGWAAIDFGFVKHSAPQLSVNLGLQNADIHIYKNIAPNTLQPSVRQFLNAALQKGKVNHAAVLFHGSLKGEKLKRDLNDVASPVLQLSADVSDLEMKYDKNWPSVSAENIVFHVAQSDIYSQYTGGRMSGLYMPSGSAQLNKKDTARILTLATNARGDAESFERIINNSPLQKTLGEKLDGWEISGPTKSTFDLKLPLANMSAAQIELKIQLLGSSIELQRQDVSFDNLTGVVKYSTAQGLSVQQLQGLLWGFPINASVSSHACTDVKLPKCIKVLAQGHISSERIASLLKQDISSLVKGETDFSLALNTSPKQGTDITVKSDLRGMELRLPGELYKAKETVSDTTIQYSILDNQFNLEAELGNTLALQMRGGPEKKQIYLNIQDQGNQKAVFDTVFNRVDSGIFIDGKLARINLGKWISFIQTLNTALANTTEGDGLNMRDNGAVDIMTNKSKTVAGESQMNTLLQEVAASARVEKSNVAESDMETYSAKPASMSDEFFIRVRDFNIGEIHYDNYAIKDVTLNVSSKPEAYHIDFVSPALSGTVVYPTLEKPIDVELDFLDIARFMRQKTQTVSSRKPFDASAIPAINASLQTLRDGDKNYGSWSLKVRSDKSQSEPLLRILDIKGNFNGVTVGGEGDGGANLLWSKDTGSLFRGMLSTSDPVEALKNLGYEPIIDAEEFRLSTRLHWDGAPHEFDLLKSRGHWRVDIRDGSFLQSPEVATGALKVLGFINLAKIVRRLSLDFSDLATTGLAFDSVKGGFSNQRGIFKTVEPIVVSGTSSEIEVTGKLNARDESVDAELAVTIPVSGNLAWIAGLTAGLPAAAGVYLVSKLMNTTVDQLTSLVYSIQGNWLDPNIAFKQFYNARKEELKDSQERDEMQNLSGKQYPSLLNCGQTSQHIDIFDYGRGAESLTVAVQEGSFGC